MAKRLSKHGELDLCYEASGCGHGIHRQLTALGHRCIVVAPSMIPRKPGERIKTDRRASEKLVILHRAGDLTRVWVPDTTPEALRDLVSPDRAMRQTLKTGVAVVSAPQLFPTPATLAARMVELAQIEPGQEVVEPSAGTGVLCEAIRPRSPPPASSPSR